MAVQPSEMRLPSPRQKTTNPRKGIETVQCPLAAVPNATIALGQKTTNPRKGIETGLG